MERSRQRSSASMTSATGATNACRSPRDHSHERRQANEEHKYIYICMSHASITRAYIHVYILRHKNGVPSYTSTLLRTAKKAKSCFLLRLNILSDIYCRISLCLHDCSGRSPTIAFVTAPWPSSSTSTRPHHRVTATMSPVMTIRAHRRRASSS